MNRLFKILCAFLMFCIVISCNKQKEVRDQLYESERVIYDSLYNAGIEKIKKEVDSLCALQREENFQNAVDSIYEVRLEEIENLLDNEQQ